MLGTARADVAIVERESSTLKLIDEALRRLGESTYGSCPRCGGPIADARLDALPFASHCRDCQETAEQEAARLSGTPRGFEEGEPHASEGRRGRSR